MHYYFNALPQKKRKRNLHHYCPNVADSWCHYKQDRANQTSNYVPGPGLPDDITKLVKPIFLQLSSNELLSKCLDGKTQNQNESINGMIWNRIPKNIFVGFDVLEFGVYDAVAHFNIGAAAAVKIFKVNLDPGEYSLKGMRKINKEQIAKGDLKGKEVKKKKKRKMLQA